jgi:hypothetical protein
MRLALVLAVLGTGCYAETSAAREVNLAWRGHARVEIEARLGTPTMAAPLADGNTLLRWRYHGRNIERLPGGDFNLKLTRTSIDLRAELRPGVMRDVEYDVATAVVDSRGTVMQLDTSWLAAGIPRGLNLRTGGIFGLHGGLSSLDDARTPLPYLGIYLGGMLGPRLALLGAYTFANGKNGDEWVHGHAWAIALQYWPTARLSVRVGPAIVADVDPGPDRVHAALGAVGAVSFAVIRAGSFVLDLRLDVTGSTGGLFGGLGLGVHLN